MAYAKQYKCKPNPIAQSLKRGRSKSIGVIVCNIDNNFFSQAINGIESVARQKDYNVIITQRRESYDREVAKRPVTSFHKLVLPTELKIRDSSIRASGTRP